MSYSFCSLLRASLTSTIFCWLAIGMACAAEPKSKTATELAEGFESYDAGTPIDGLEDWEAFRGFSGDSPVATVSKGLGRNNSNALAVSHSGEFRADSWGVKRRLAQPLTAGVAWLDCYFHPPRQWTGGLFFDARSGRSVAASIGGAVYKRDDLPEPVLRAHASWTHSYWRIYRNVPLEADWYRLTMRLDLDRGTYAAWIDDEPLGEELPLCSREPIDHVFLGLGGTPDDPARIDELTVSRSAPDGREARDLLPSPEANLQFRMAVIGDPQLGFSDYAADVIRFKQTVEQVNRSGAELTLIMGDMVHDNDNEQAYRDLKGMAEQLKSPVYFVRGNHERLDLYQKHFHPQSDFAFKHQGWRFVFLDAIGNQRGLTEKQLQFVEREFEQATAAGEEIVLCLHVSPWQDNEKGRGAYNQVGQGRDRLVELLDEHQALFCLSGHYHRGLWHHQEEATHYMVFGGTAQVKQGWLSWCIFDIYPDRVVVHEKPVYFAYERPDSKAFYNFNYGEWTEYEGAVAKYPYLQHGPAVVSRSAGEKK